MCLIALALDEHRRFPLVVAANRDEYFERPTARLAWWSPEGGGPDILSGRDLQAGGTWLGLTAQGRLAMVTNVRRPWETAPDTPSRGHIVSEWLRGDRAGETFWPQAAMRGYAPFNLMAFDFRQGDSFWASSERPCPVRLERGLYGLSNATLDVPWTKVTQLKARLSEALKTSDSVDAMANLLFEALADRQPALDANLPQTGVGRNVERMLSPAFIRSPDGRYGTRCSTLIITERVRKRLITHVLERSYTVGSSLALMRRSVLKDWPPRYMLDSPEPPVRSEIGPVNDAELPATVEPVKKRRIRSLLKPVR